MDTIKFLQLMAKSTHYDKGLYDLISNQPVEITVAYHLNDSKLLKNYLGESEFVANPTDVTYLL